MPREPQGDTKAHPRHARNARALRTARGKAAEKVRPSTADYAFTKADLSAVEAAVSALPAPYVVKVSSHGGSPHLMLRHSTDWAALPAFGIARRGPHVILYGGRQDFRQPGAIYPSMGEALAQLGRYVTVAVAGPVQAEA